MKSYGGFLRAAKGHRLLGGVFEHRSSRFERREDAEAWLAQAIEVNKKCGNEIARSKVIEYNKPWEIPA